VSTHTVCIPHCITFYDSTQYHSTKPLTYTIVFGGTGFYNNHYIGQIIPPPGASVHDSALYYSMTDSLPLKPFKICYYVNSSINGDYDITETVSNGIGETSIKTDSIRVYSGPLPRVTSNVTIDQGAPATICYTGNTFSQNTFNWTQPDTASYLSCPTCSCTVVTPSVTTQYTLTLVDSQNGCTDSAFVTVIVDVICKDVFVANAFSPNGDGLNDILHVRSNCPITNLSFKIFDRWGEEVFVSTNEDIGWDGTYKGKLMDTAVFMYTVDGFLSTGTQVKKKGNVTLLR
jgi:gliding motility-associated-like protein